MFYARTQFAPMRVRTAVRFSAGDPWNADRATEWSVEGYLWVPKHWQGLPKSRLNDPPMSYGLRSEIDGVERMLPDSLGHLVRTSAVAPEALPRLLAEITPEIKKADYKPMLRMNIRRNLGVYAVVSVLCLLGYLALHATATFPEPIGSRGPLWRGMLLTFGAAGLLSWALFGPLALGRLRRREKQMAWAVERAGGGLHG